MDGGLEGPGCWATNGVTGLGAQCTDDMRDTATLIDFELIPADAVELPRSPCQFDADGFVVTYRINRLGRYCYKGGGVTRANAFVTVEAPT